MALTFLSPIHKAGRQIGEFLAPFLARMNLSNPEGHLVSYLRTYGPCAITDLHRVFGFRRSTLTSMLDRLEGKRLLLRNIHPEDRRSILLSLTKKGLKAGDKIQIHLEELEDRIRGKIRKTDLEGFREVMAAIAEVTGEENGERKVLS